MGADAVVGLTAKVNRDLAALARIEADYTGAGITPVMREVMGAAFADDSPGPTARPPRQPLDPLRQVDPPIGCGEP